METQIWHCLLALLLSGGEGLEKGQQPLPTFLSGRKLSPSFCLDPRHFSSSLYATGVFQAAIPVLELLGSLCGFFWRNCLVLQKFLPLTQSLLVLLQPEVVGTYLPGTGKLGWGPGMGLVLLAPEIPS